MSLIKGFLMSLGMFSIIPSPISGWNEKYMPTVIPCLPLVGAIIGFIWYTLGYAVSKLSAPLMIQSSVVLFAPFVLSGFIHADGYMDTADAVFSRRSPEEKKRILKDPRCGAFAVIAIAGILIFQFSAVHAIMDEQKNLLTLLLIPVVSRCVAGPAMLNLKQVFETGYSASFRHCTKPRHTVFICILMVLCLLAAWLAPGAAVAPLLAEIVTGLLATVFLYKQFQGMSGDLSGCIITVGEFAALLCMAL